MFDRADIDREDCEDDWGALHLAAIWDRVDESDVLGMLRGDGADRGGGGDDGPSWQRWPICLHHPATIDGRAGSGFTPFHMAQTSATVGAALIRQAAGPWTPATHRLFPAAARARAVSLLNIGYQLRTRVRTAANGSAPDLHLGAWTDVWMFHIMPLLVHRHSHLERGCMVTFRDLNSKPKLNHVSVGRICGDLLNVNTGNERWPVRVLGSWIIVGKEMELYWVPSHPNGAIVTSVGDGLLPTQRPGPYKFRPANLVLLTGCPIERHRALEPAIKIAKSPSGPECIARQQQAAFDFARLSEEVNAEMTG